MPLLSVNTRTARAALALNSTMAIANGFLVPQIDLQIFDNILQMNSVKANVVHGCNVLQSMLHMHAVVDGYLAYKGNKTDVSRNAILDVLDDIKATDMEQPHALEFCFNVLNGFILLMDNAGMHQSHFYGDFSGFLLSFAFYKDMASIYTKLKERCVDPQTMRERNIEIIDVDMGHEEGKRIRSTYRHNLTKSGLVPLWTNPTCRKHKYVCISKAMNELKRRNNNDVYLFSGFNVDVEVPKWVIDSELGSVDWPVLTVTGDEDEVDMLYVWFQAFHRFYKDTTALWEKVADRYVFVGDISFREFDQFMDLIITI